MKVYPISFNGKPKNYTLIDNAISCSAQPMKEDFVWLKEQGVTDIINLRTMVVFASDFDEQKTVESLGMKYHHLPSRTRQPNINTINTFLDLIEEIKINREKAHFHCSAGADRTGMYAFIYKMLNGLGSLAENENEWIARGHHQNLYPNLIKQTKELLPKLARK
ncbi:tyrosine-protein phosphatase [bacterium]|nr:tyrosine-protein phosphatase [bacterium]